MKYKFRLLLTLVTVLFAGFINSGVGEAAKVPVETSASIATINGGDAAFVAQHAVHAGLSTTSFLFDLAVIVFLIVIWVSPIKKALKSTEETN